MPDVRLLLDPELPPATLRLKDGSLEQLLGGQYALRFWLQPVDGEDGVYTLHARVADEDPRLEGLVRAILWDTVYEDGEPNIPEPTAEVAEIQTGWREFFEGMYEAASELAAEAKSEQPEPGAEE